MLDMFTITLGLQLAEEIYPAALAELEYSILPSERGFLLKLNGYNEKLPVLLNIIIKYFKQVADTLSQGLFEAVKDAQKKAYYNGYFKPKRLSKEVRLSILQDIYFSHYDKYCAIDDITLDKLRSFLGRLGESFYVQGLIQGNIMSSTAVRVTNEMIGDMKFLALPQNALPILRVAEIPNGERCCKLMSANEDSTNSIITNYYQCGPIALKDNMILEFIMLLIEEPLFDILRTKEQLGYDVYPTIRDTFGMLGYSITVNTQADKHATEHVDSRIEAFLKQARKLIKKLSDRKFSQTKADLIKMKQVVDFDLDDEVQRNWAEICSRRYQFDRVRQEIKAIEQLKMGEVKQWWDDHTMGGNKQTFRKMSVQVVGHVKPSDVKTEHEQGDEAKSIIDNIVEQTLDITEADTSQSTTGEQKNKVTFDLKLLGTEIEAKKLNKSEDYFISDVEQFKKKLVFIDGR